MGNHQCCPEFLKDGEHYLFAASKVITEAANAVYAQGRLLYVRGRPLMPQPFDVKALGTTGEAVAIAESVGHFPGPLSTKFFT